MAENVYDSYQADHVHVERSALRSLSAQTANLDQTAVQRLESQAVNASNSAVGVVHASTFEAGESAVGFVASDYAKLENSRVAVLLAPRVSGNVHAVITLPVAFAFGFGYFFARRLAGALFGKSGR